MSKKHHPDKSKDPEATKKFIEIKDAYETLKDPQKRAEYNRKQNENGPAENNIKEEEHKNQIENERREEERQRQIENERRGKERQRQIENERRGKERQRQIENLRREKRQKQLQLVAVVCIVFMMFGGWLYFHGKQNIPSDDPNKSTNGTNFVVNNSVVNNTNGMEFILIPAGNFLMGSPDEENRNYNDGPVHEVSIEKSFYLGKYEVTQKQWREVMGNNPSYFKGDDLPVDSVSWYDVQEFIEKLNEREGTDKYRLPSEAEWEYACRAGTTTSYSFGDDESDIGIYAWYKDNSDDKTHPVGLKKPNLWGLYDMDGNVWELCQDTYHENYDDAPSDGNAWESGNRFERVRRGGVWYRSAEYCNSAARGKIIANSCSNTLGFRILMEC